MTVLGIVGISTFWKNCHCNQSPLGTQLGVETQPLRVTYGAKINSLNAMIIR